MIRIVADGELLAGAHSSTCRDRIRAGGERGLLGLAFHPDYAATAGSSSTTRTTQGDTVVAEYASSATDPDRADPTPVAMLLHIDQPFPNHNGGDLVFGPDGMLYIGMGDGGSGGDPMGNGQRVDTLLGKLLRIDVDHPPTARPTRIPPANCSGCPAGALPEICAYGLRNPWRFTFDRATGDLWIGDVGQGRYEEVDHVPLADASGANFGWNLMEGRHCYPSGNSCDRTGLTLPVAEYDHSAGDCSITGGYVYRGAAFPALAGWYLFSDYCSGRDPRRGCGGPSAGADPTVLLETRGNIASFGEDDAGELYVADTRPGRSPRWSRRPDTATAAPAGPPFRVAA